MTIAGIFEISAWTSICRQEAASATMAARVVARCPAFYVLPFMPLRVLPFADPGPIWWRHHAEAINLPGATALFEEPFVPGARHPAREERGRPAPSANEECGRDDL